MLTAVCALLVAGCGDSGEGSATPSTSAGSSTTVTSTPTASETPTVTETSPLPPLPEAAKQNTPEGAEAYIRYYFDVVNLLHRQPELGVLQQVVDPGCESCANAEETISYLVETDGALEGDLMVISQMTRLGGGAPDVTRFSAEWVMPSNRAISSSGAVLDTLAEEKRSGILAAKWTGDAWLFYDAATESS